ncbi:Dimethyl sulfoxide reductase DmsA precursor [Caloramator mitchellensis]|uniref:Dimethyl sulfoxide reductase DmsA n=1 Tax=Caloramator mitchellensis TaxID=908809 RepID=A0A0R3K585_CALMK|nr:molybdopterin-dependent oxidoreductase [Caloramator mitchellensis]KRQ88098.1 Dimethyl sulfoxide reductase DmsA precursor [Caloramator mitchellensis]
MKIRSGCPRDCYSGCSLILEIEDGRIKNIDGDPLNRATQGLICIKGKSYLERNYGKQRLRYPLKRIGKRGENNFKRIVWEEAISEICDNIENYQKYSPRSILFYKGSGEIGTVSKGAYGFWNQLNGYTTTYGDLCFSAGVEATIQTYGRAIHNAPWDIENAKSILVWGKNTAETNFQEMLLIKKAKSNGAKLIVIDPVKTKTAKEADIYIQIEPETDIYLALGIANYILNNNLADLDFISKYTYGFEEFKKSIKNYDIDLVTEKCKISKAEFESIIKIICNNKPFKLICGLGIQRRKNGGQTVRAISLIPAILGSIGIRGGGFNYANLSAPKLIWPIKYETPKDVDYIHVAELGKGIKEKNIKMAFIQAANPVISNPDTIEIIDAFNNMEFVVVIDNYMSATAKYADIVLPAAATFEYFDIFKSYWHPYVILIDKAHEPLDECKHESEIYRMMASKLKLEVDLIPANNEELINRILEASNINATIDDLRKVPFLDQNYNEIAFEDKHFNTVTGKIQFKSKTMKKWKQSVIPEASGMETNNEYPFNIISYHSYEKINSQYSDIDRIRKITGAPKVLINEMDAEEKGILNDDKVLIYNANGSITATAYLTNDVKRGTISIPFGYLLEDGANVNTLLKPQITDIGNGTVFHSLRVDFKKY